MDEGRFYIETWKFVEEGQPHTRGMAVRGKAGIKMAAGLFGALLLSSIVQLVLLEKSRYLEVLET